MLKRDLFARGLLLFSLVFGLVAGFGTPALLSARAAPQSQATNYIVISQVYGGGGNTSAPYTHDYVELFNPGASPVSINGWSVQYTSGTGSGFFSANVVSLSGSISPGQYFLVQLDSGGLIGVPLPAPDVMGSIAMSASSGKVIIANTSVGLPCNGSTTSCSPSDAASIVDLVGYGTANYYEGANAAPTPSATLADLRSGNGCTDTDDNGDDFSVGAPAPRNTATAANLCMDPLTVTAAANQTGTAASDLTATANANLTGTASAAALTGTSAALTGSPTPTSSNTPTRTATPTTTPPTSTPTATPTLGLVINEVAWMGTVAASGDEWIELYNPGSSAVDLAGWTLRSTDSIVNIALTGTIGAGGYFIIAPSSAFTDVLINQAASFTLDNNGKALQLLSPSSVLVDTANSDGGSWPAGVASPSYASMERRGTTLDAATTWFTFAGIPTKHDRNNNLVKGTPGYSNWALTVTATATRTPTVIRTPTRAPGSIPTPTARFVINEFLPRAGFDWNQDGKVDVFDEFIEVANLGPVSGSLKNWKLDDETNQGSLPYTLPDRILQPGEHAVFFGKQTNVSLSDGGDTVRLLSPNNVIMDAVTYSVIEVADQTWCRLPDIRGSWFEDCFPTPGVANSRSGAVPAAPPGTGLEEQLCLLPDTLPDEFKLAECNGYGADMWQSMYWDAVGWGPDRFVPQNGSKWETFVK